MKWTILLGIAVLLGSSQLALAGEPLTIRHWGPFGMVNAGLNGLRPLRPQEEALPEALAARKTLKEIFQGQKVRILGYPRVVDASLEVKEFLLVGNQALCLHGPSPSPRKTIHVKMAKNEAFPLNRLEGPVWVEGSLQLKRSRVGKLEAAFRMDEVKAAEVESFRRPL